MPTISVIMPLFNRAATVGGAIDSVLAQDFPDFELVIVDDASKDDSVAVVESYGDPRIRLLKQGENRGGGAARNRGIREAAGEIICFLDSDDVFLPHKLGFIADYFRRHGDVDALLDSFEIVYPVEKKRPPARRINPSIADSARIAEGVLARTISKATPALSARRSTLLAAGLFDETLRRRQDFELVMRLTGCCRCAATDQVLWRKFWSEDTITAQSSTRIGAMLEMCERTPDYLTNPEFRVGLAKDLARHCLRLVFKGRFGAVRKDLRRFADVHGVAATARLVREGLFENARRAVARKPDVS